MTELQWLIKILTQSKLSPALKDMFIERIGEVESKLSTTTYNAPIRPGLSIPIGQIQQAASTQRLLEEQAIIQLTNPITPPPLQRTIKTLETQPMISTGNGTKGPKKF